VGSVDIVFTNTLNAPKEYYPQPASKIIPDWYKNMQSYVNGEKKPLQDSKVFSTIKKCMPVFDSISSGYIIPTPCDIWVTQKKQNEKNIDELQPFYQWPVEGFIAFHPIEQAPEHPNNTGHKISYPKWINPWSIKTPPGYSCIFVQPWHRESVFTILPGVVDTDEYIAPVNFPFVLNDINFEGLIPAGTPMAQVIPFKRDSWKMVFGDEEKTIDQSKVANLIKTKFFDAYKNSYRKTKEYK
jgi:hypothetical protein